MKDEESRGRILTLRSIAFAILIVGNIIALYTSGRFKRRYPQPKTISNFALIFHNVHTTLSIFSDNIKEKYPNATIKEIFKIQKMEPFYTLYNKKL
jgi:uncharacterized membrane protein